MTERNNLYSAFSDAAWGYFFLTFDLNLGTVSLFPRFAGYLLFLSAIAKLKEERRDLALLRPLCILLAAWNGLDWLASWTGGDIDGQILFADLLAAAAGLYFQYQFLTDLAALAETYQGEGACLDVRLRRRRSVYIVLVTAVSVLADLPADLFPVQQAWIMMPLVIVACIAGLAIMIVLFELRRRVSPDTAEEKAE